MITKFNCSCGNNNPKLAYDYDGCLGYSAIVCKLCGKYYDFTGVHDQDEWSANFVINKKQLQP